MNDPGLPELFRGVRHLGAPLADARQQAAHDAWFRPVLQARAAAQADRDPARLATHFTPRRLIAAYEQVITEMALAMHPAGGAAMRAQEARIEEAAAPVFVALRHLERAEQEVHRAPTSSAQARWLDQLRTVIAAVDMAFVDVLHAINA